MIAVQPVLVPVLRLGRAPFFALNTRQQNWLSLLSPELMMRPSRLRREGATERTGALAAQDPPEALDWSLRCLSRAGFSKPDARRSYDGQGFTALDLGNT